MTFRTLRVPFNMVKLLFVMCSLIFVAESMKDKPSQLFRTIATAGQIREHQLEDRESDWVHDNICYAGYIRSSYKEVQISSVESCGSHCRALPTAGYFGYRAETGDCSCYTTTEGCPKGNTAFYDEWKSYRISKEVDCTWNDYADWSDCSVTCGDGTRTRTRTEATSASNGGDQCTGGPTETEACDAGSCPGCNEDEFQCENGECIPLDYASDSDADCGDNSDVPNCAVDHDCLLVELTCNRGRCTDDTGRRNCNPACTNNNYCWDLDTCRCGSKYGDACIGNEQCTDGVCA